MVEESKKFFLKLWDGWKLVCNADHVRSTTPRWFLNFQRKASKPREGSDHEMDLKERVEDAILCRFKWSLLPFSLLSAILCLRLPMHRPNVGQLPKNHCQQVEATLLNDITQKTTPIWTRYILKGVVVLLLMKSSNLKPLKLLSALHLQKRHRKTSIARYYQNTEPSLEKKPFPRILKHSEIVTSWK